MDQLCSLSHRIYNLCITGASAEIPLQSLLDFLFCRIGFSVQQDFCRENKTRCAESALNATHLHKSLLYRMHVSGGAEPFNRNNLFLVQLACANETGAGCLPVQDDRAGAALSLATSLLHALDLHNATEKVQCPHTGIDLSFIGFPVQCESYCHANSSKPPY